MPSLPLKDLDFIDLYVRLDAQETPLYRPKERNLNTLNEFVPAPFMETVERLGAEIKVALRDSPEGSLEFEGMRCRLSCQTMADGSVWACARQISVNVPDLNKLGFAPHIYGHMHSLGKRDGLILISGSTGQGKTTTAVALLNDFMCSYGGMAITIEDPVEYLLKGRHGEHGHCFQMEAREDEDWAAFLKQSLRWAPRYIYVGEIRTPKAAEQMLRAATTGHTVITTMHAGAPEEALMGLLFFAEQAMGVGAKDVLATSLTALVHQQLRDTGPFVRYLFTEENAPGDPIRSLIRENKVGMISTYIDRVAARLTSQAQNFPNSNSASSSLKKPT